MIRADTNCFATDRICYDTFYDLTAWSIMRTICLSSREVLQRENAMCPVGLPFSPASIDYRWESWLLFHGCSSISPMDNLQSIRGTILSRSKSLMFLTDAWFLLWDFQKLLTQKSMEKNFLYFKMVFYCVFT